MKLFRQTPITAHAAIISALVRGEASGRDIKKRVSDMTKGSMSLGPSTLYPALRSLEADGLIKAREEEGGEVRRGRPRRIYTLTGDGAKAYNEFRQAAAGLAGVLVPV